MEAKEYETLLEEAETRMDRLRALYEQWFQGIERLEPTIPRKEIERRMHVLRKNQPRTTALRFRFNMLQQRFTTFQAYWGRVGRQIEEGTYRRDLLKARRKREEAREVRSFERRVRDDAIEVELEIDMEVNDGLGSEVEAALAAVTAPSMPVQAPPARRMASFSPFAMTGRGGGHGAGRPPATPPAQQPAPITATFGRPAGVAPRPFAPAAPAAAARDEPKTDPAPPPCEDGPAAPARGAIGSPPVPKPAAPAGPAWKPPPPGAFASKPPAPAAPRPAATPPAAVAAPKPAPPAAPAAAAPRPAAPAARPAVAALRPAPAAPAAAKPTLPEERLRNLYDQYIDARRRNNERTDNVKYETLAKSIKEQIPKLQEKHRGKAIDFEVVIKDGRVGIKPTTK